MANNIENIERYSPAKLLRGFGKTKFLMFMILAVLLHVLVIGTTSVTYIYYTLNPEAAQALEEKKDAEKKAAEKKTVKTETVSAKEINQTAAASQPANAVLSSSSSGTSATVKTDTSLAVERKNTPVMKEITEIAKSNEIPRAPDDLGIKIEDTNPK